MFDLLKWQARSRSVLAEISGRAEFLPMSSAQPWNAASLNALESEMLQTWQHPAEMPAANRELYELFLGEGLCRLFGGKWQVLGPELLGKDAETGCGLGVAYRDGSIDVVSSLVPLAFWAGTGTWWQTVFGTTRRLQS